VKAGWGISLEQFLLDFVVDTDTDRERVLITKKRGHQEKMPCVSNIGREW